MHFFVGFLWHSGILLQSGNAVLFVWLIDAEAHAALRRTTAIVKRTKIETRVVVVIVYLMGPA